MRLNKLQRFAAIKTFPNVFERPKDKKGNWHKQYFNNACPITLELACGKGEYSVALAQKNPRKNYIGVDIKGNRIYVGAKKGLEIPLKNLAFLRCQIEDIDQYFAPGEVSELWLTFPDPFLRGSKYKKRLTHPRFLRLYQNILQPQASLHLKTDSADLMHFTQTVCHLYQLPVEEQLHYCHHQALPEHPDPTIFIPTHYERQNISRSQKNFYIRFRLSRQLQNTALDAILKERLNALRYKNLKGV